MLTIKLISAGLKNGLPKADFYLDCRGIPNPYRAIPNGNIHDMEQWVLNHDGGAILRDFKSLIDISLENLPARRQGEDPYKRPYTVCFFCAYGQHRSPTMKRLFARIYNTFKADVYTQLDWPKYVGKLELS